MKLEELQPEAKARGILPNAAVTVVSVEWHRSDALTLVYREPNGVGWLTRFAPESVTKVLGALEEFVKNLLALAEAQEA